MKNNYFVSGDHEQTGDKLNLAGQLCYVFNNHLDFVLQLKHSALLACLPILLPFQTGKSVLFYQQTNEYIEKTCKKPSLVTESINYIAVIFLKIYLQWCHCIFLIQDDIRHSLNIKLSWHILVFICPGFGSVCWEHLACFLFLCCFDSLHLPPPTSLYIYNPALYEEYKLLTMIQLLGVIVDDAICFQQQRDELNGFCLEETVERFGNIFSFYFGFTGRKLLEECFEFLYYIYIYI